MVDAFISLGLYRLLERHCIEVPEMFIRSPMLPVLKPFIIKVVTPRNTDAKIVAI